MSYEPVDFNYEPFPIANKCTCGAQHTSFPDHHSEWCDIGQPSGLPKSFKGLRLVFQTESRQTTYLDRAAGALYINKGFYEQLSDRQRLALLEHEYSYFQQKQATRITFTFTP
jgi:hypothetical protein